MRRPRTHAKLTAIAVAMTCLLSACAPGERAPTGCETDAITSQNLANLRSFTDWLDRHQVDGMMGEAGWPGEESPDAQEWNALGERWLDEARAADLPVYIWAAAPWWSKSDSDAYYRSRGKGLNVNVAAPKAVVFEDHLADGLRGGVNLAEGTFGAPINEEGTYANGNPGELNTEYTYPTYATLEYLAGRGLGEARFAVLWERLQPEVGQPLDELEVRRVRQVFADADRAGINLVLDVHNFARYVEGDADSRTVHRLGDPALPASALVDLWTRLATDFRTAPALSGYNLMNEPFDLPGGAAAWEQMSLDTSIAIRAVDADRPLWVEGYDFAGAHVFADHHPEPWLPDSLGPVVYQAHQYFDSSYEGSYRRDYATENAIFAERGAPCRP